jgi:hypothetical protein
MHFVKKSVLLGLVLLDGNVLGMAQVEKVAVRTVRLSCGMCAVFSEMYLRQLPSIDQIIISKSKEAVMITYKSGATFQPADIRSALKKTEVGVEQFQIAARGHVQAEGGKQFFMAGKDKFLLVVSPNSPQASIGAPVSVEGIVNDATNPMELKLLTVKPIQK